MVELIMFIVVVSVGVAGVLQIINIATRNSADPLARKQALAIAEALLEEVQLAAFTFCDPTDANADAALDVTGCTTPETLGPEGLAGDLARPFDNINDYVTQWGVAQQAFGDPPVDVNGTPLGPAGAQYNATLMLTPAPLNGIPSAADPANPVSMAGVNALRITVTVTGGGETITLDGYRTRHAPRAVP